MALIGKIREKSVLLVIIIGLALVAFIFTGIDKMSFGNDEGIGLGTVYGNSVDPATYYENVKKFYVQDSTQAANEGRPFTGKDQEASEDKAWNYNVNQIILDAEYEKLGIEVNESEFTAYLHGENGFDVLPELEQNFKDSLTQMFSPALLDQAIESLQKSENPADQQRWKDSKDYYMNKRRLEKYQDILKQGVYVTKLEAKDDYLAQNETKSISFIMNRFSEIQDDKVTISDEEMKKFYEEHKNEKKYENRMSTRQVKYFTINVVPSKKDSADFNSKMKSFKSEFENATSDSTFVMKNSDVKFFSSTHMATFKPENDPKKREGMTFPMSLDSVFQNASIGQVVGPYDDNGYVRLAKVLDFNTKKMKVRHILLAAAKGDDAKVAATEKKADSLLKFINKDNFEQYVTQYTEDPGSKSTGGVYDDFMDYEMVPEFSKFCSEKPVGSIGRVTTDYGVHIIEVLEHKAVKYPVLAIIQKTFKPTLETKDDFDRTAYNLLYKLDKKVAKESDNIKKVELFDSLVRLDGFASRVVTIQENKPTINIGEVSTFTENRVLELAFSENAKVGDLCSAPLKDQNQYIIAMVSNIKLKGTPSFEDMEPRIRQEVLKEKKAAMLLKKMNVKGTLTEIASKLGIEVLKEEITFSRPSIPKAGMEAELIGLLFSGLKDGETTKAIVGENGVYIIRINKTNKAVANNNYDTEIEKLLTMERNNVINATQNALNVLADPIDNRRFNRANIRR
jgi:peptidyl-prolyl cis-trans isomerase D